MSTRITRPHLHHLATTLHPRSINLLNFLAQHRFATTKHLARLHRPHHASDASAARQTARLTRHLHSQGLISHLARRIGGQRAGSSGLIWHLSEAGYRLLALRAGNSPNSRHRHAEPSPTFLTHTLAITEARIRIKEAARTHDFHLHRIEPEPLCWRRHLGIHGQTEWLKPDLGIIARNHDIDTHYWFEIDMGTENPARIKAKARIYHRHYQSGTEQHARGVFPATIWVCATPERHHQLQQVLDAIPAIPPGMFTTCHIDTLATTLYHHMQGDAP